MLIFLIKLIFSAITSLSNLISRLTLSAIAYLLVLIIHGLKVPGETALDGLQKLGEALLTCLGYVVELVMELSSSLVSTIFGLLLEGLTGSASVTGSAIGGLLEKTRESFDGLFEDIPELAQEFSSMIATVVSDLWKNSLGAVRYVQENA